MKEKRAHIMLQLVDEIAFSLDKSDKVGSDMDGLFTVVTYTSTCQHRLSAKPAYGLTPTRR